MNATAATCTHGRVIKLWPDTLHSPIERDAWEEWVTKGQGLTLTRVALPVRLGCRKCGSPISPRKRDNQAHRAKVLERKNRKQREVYRAKKRAARAAKE